MEGQCGERWVRVGAFSCCSARSCTSTRKVDNPHLFSSLLFYSILFWASFPRLLSLVFPPPILSFNCLHPACRGGCAREEPGDERWWLADTEQTAAAARRASGRTLPSSWRRCRWAGQACASTFSVLCGALCPTGAGGNPLPSTAPVAAACCRGAELRSWRQWHFKHCRCLLSGCESVFHFQALCYLSGSSLISPFCPSCRWGVNLELYVPHVRCH